MIEGRYALDSPKDADTTSFDTTILKKVNALVNG